MKSSKRKVELIEYIRKTWSVTGEKQDCYICNKFALVAELHHVLHVAKMADAIIRNNCKLLGILETVELLPSRWLCPTCHALLHKATSEFHSNKMKSEFVAGHEFKYPQYYDCLSVLANNGEIHRLLYLVSQSLSCEYLFEDICHELSIGNSIDNFDWEDNHYLSEYLQRFGVETAEV